MFVLIIRLFTSYKSLTVISIPPQNDTGYSDLLNKEPVKTFVPEKMVVVDRLS